MKELISVLQGAFTTFAGCAAAGFLVLGALRARLQPAERFGLSVAVGAPFYSLLLGLLLASGQLRRTNSAILALLLVAAAVWRAAKLPAQAAQSGRWYLRLLLWMASLAFGAVWFMNAAAPDITPPGASPALEQAATLWARHPLPPGDQWSAALPLWLAAFTAGRQSACSVLHLLFLFSLAALVHGSVRRWLGTNAAFAAALLVITNPGLGAVAADAGTEALLLLQACAAIALLLLVWKDGQRHLWRVALPCAAFALLLARDPQAQWFRGFLFELVPGPWLVVPALAVAAGWLLRDNIASVLLIAVFACLTSWPRNARALAPSVKKIAMSASPRLVLRQDGVDGWLQQHLPGYIEARFLDERTPAGSIIVLEPAIARAWTSRRVLPAPASLVLPQSAYDDRFVSDREERIRVQPTPRSSFSLPNRARVAEVRFFLRGAEVPRQPSWRVSCPAAFDNSPVTFCDSDLRARFAEPIAFDEILLFGKRGRPARPARGLRGSVRTEWKRLGVTHILASRDSDLFDELSRRSPYWHVAEIGERNGSHLFRLE